LRSMIILVTSHSEHFVWQRCQYLLSILCLEHLRKARIRFSYLHQGAGKPRESLGSRCHPFVALPGSCKRILQHRVYVVRVLDRCFKIRFSMKSIILEVPLFLQYLTDGAQFVEVRGATVGECLENLVEQFPLVRKLLFNQNDELFGHIDVYVNGVSTFPRELARPVQEGDKITMLYLITGG
jgi:molybdopterin converting factor small subunit